MSDSTDLRPFRIDVPEADLDDLRERIARTRWPREVPGVGWSRGVPVGYLSELAEYWAAGFDWRAREAELNELPHFKTEIDGQDIHFIHIRSAEPGAVPLLLTHGWPSTPVEFMKLIDLLGDFHLVMPSLPGYGFSTPAREAGWGNLFRVAQAWAELMSRLGYERYAVHGTDVGSGVAGILAMIDAKRVLGTHLAGTVAAMPFGPPLESTG